MEPYLMISHLNDFIFCPRSIYFHQLYGRISKSLYQSDVQVKGINAHKSIDSKKYTTSKTVLQSIEIYSEQYRLCGKIDTYDEKKQQIVERKKKIKVIYDGYIHQLYAQYFCLTEMGYPVKQLKLYSMDDNKNYSIALPQESPEHLVKFEALIDDMNSFQFDNNFSPNPKKCKNCIYNNLCDTAVC